MRKEKRRQRIVKDLSKTLGEMSKEDMLTMKSDVLEAYRVVISDADLRSLIEEWGKDMKLGGLGGEALFDVLRANGVITSKY